MGKRATDEQFEAMEGLIHQAVRRTIAKYGGEYDELFSLAQECFVRACRSWRPSKGSINKWVLFVIYCDLADYRRKELKYSSRFRNDAGDYEMYSTQNSFMDCLDEMHDDAKDIVHLIFDVPTCLRQLLMHDSPVSLDEMIQKSNGNKAGVRSAVRRYLKSIGWEAERINFAFNNIAENIA